MSSSSPEPSLIGMDASAPAEARGALVSDRRERILFVAARNLIPVIGIIFLGWSAQNLIVLYFADTLGALWAIFTAMSLYYGEMNAPQSLRGRLNTAATMIFASTFLTGFFAIPLGIPLVILLSIADWSVRDALADSWFMPALVSVAGLALTGMLRYLSLIRNTSLERSPIKQEFAIVFTRWVVVLLLIYNVAFLLGGWGAYVLVIGYAAATVMSQVYPERFANLFGKERKTRHL